MIFILVVLVEPLKRLISRALHQQFVSEFEKVQKLAMEIEEHAKRTGDVDSLQALVEERVPHALGLERVRLLRSPIPGDTSDRKVFRPRAHRVPISRGGEAIAFLEVVPATRRSFRRANRRPGDSRRPPGGGSGTLPAHR